MESTSNTSVEYNGHIVTRIICVHDSDDYLEIISDNPDEEQGIIGEYLVVVQEGNHKSSLRMNHEELIKLANIHEHIQQVKEHKLMKILTKE